MFDFGKEITLSHAIGTFFERLEERLADREGYGIADWYKDLSWGVRLAVEADLPLFVGKNEQTWLTLADEYSRRADFHAGNSALFVPWDNPDGDVTWAHAGNNIEDVLKFGRIMVSAIRTEDADWSGPLPSGEKGVNLAEAIKLTRYFTEKFWATELRWSRVPNPNKKWLQAFRSEVMAAYTSMGEPTHGGDLGQPGDITGNIPWSMPGQ